MTSGLAKQAVPEPPAWSSAVLHFCCQEQGYLSPLLAPMWWAASRGRQVPCGRVSPPWWGALVFGGHQSALISVKDLYLPPD